MPEPTAEASSLFVDLPDARSCVAARVPAEWCLETPQRECHAQIVARGRADAAADSERSRGAPS